MYFNPKNVMKVPKIFDGKMSIQFLYKGKESIRIVASNNNVIIIENHIDDKS